MSQPYIVVPASPISYPPPTHISPVLSVPRVLWYSLISQYLTSCIGSLHNLFLLSRMSHSVLSESDAFLLVLQVQAPISPWTVF